MTSPAPGATPPPASGLPRGSRLLLTAACATIFIAGLKAASGLVVPILLASFIALLCFPGMRALQRWRVPTVLSILIVVTAATVVSIGVSAVVGTSLQQFGEDVPEYVKTLEVKDDDVIQWLQSLPLVGDAIPEDALDKLLNPSLMLDLVSGTATAVVSALSNLFLITLLVVFMLIEANGLGAKIHLAMGKPDRVLEEVATIREQVSGYVSIKAATSLLTGVLASVLALLTDVGNPVLWGFVAFLFNFIPNIGSIIAAIPPVLLALAQHGVGTATVVIAGYLVINMVIGNVIEPRVMGNRLGLSALVVFLSLIFWSWVWGPIGMLLSVPLTVVVKIVFEHIDDLRPIAVLLGPEGEAREE